MKQNRIFSATLAFSLLVLISSCGSSPEGKLIITKVPAGAAEPYRVTEELGRYIPQAVIAMANPGDPASEKILTEDFYSACSPDFSWDGYHILFAGQKKKSDSWQIYEMNLKNRNYRQVTNFNGNCTDPVFLPLDKVIFTGSIAASDSMQPTEYQLYVCNADGSEMQQIAFHPYADFATTVMKDGRLLCISRELTDVKRSPALIVMRPDGTKADVFYQGEAGTTLVSRSHEAGGKFYFIESDSTGQTEIISIRYNQPLHSRQQVSSGSTGIFGYVFPGVNGHLLVTYKEKAGGTFGVYEFDESTGKSIKAVMQSKDFDVVDVKQVHRHQRPKKLPSEVDMGVKTGLIMCQDINFTGIGLSQPEHMKASKIEVIGIDSSLGIIPVENDGSFYLKVIADRPFRIRTLDNNNNIINNGSSWIWLRPNERRGCVGCHEDKETAPMNRVPQAVKKDPVSVPVITMFEKEVELE